MLRNLVSDELALFELPTSEPRRAAHGPDRGRARERYARTVTVDVTVRRIPVLLDAAFDASPAVDLAGADVDDDVTDSAQIGQAPGAALSWLLDPLDGMRPLLEAGRDRRVTGGGRGRPCACPLRLADAG